MGKRKKSYLFNLKKRDRQQSLGGGQLSEALKGEDGHEIRAWGSCLRGENKAPHNPFSKVFFKKKNKNPKRWGRGGRNGEDTLGF